jgi:hypothetical protein
LVPVFDAEGDTQYTFIIDCKDCQKNGIDLWVTNSPPYKIQSSPAQNKTVIISLTL